MGTGSLQGVKCGWDVLLTSGVPKGEADWGIQPPATEIPKTLQNRAKLNPIVKTVKNC